jgi:hypothetical protein
MIGLAIDPGIFALGSLTGPQLQSRLTYFRELRSIQLNHNWVTLLLPAGTAALLAAENLFPATPVVRDALTSHNLNRVFSVADITFQISQLLQCNSGRAMRPY